MDALMDGLEEGFIEGLMEGFGLAEGLEDGFMDGALLATFEGLELGTSEGAVEIDGKGVFKDGDQEGKTEGARLGSLVGALVGRLVGGGVLPTTGAIVGEEDGDSDGLELGFAVGGGVVPTADGLFVVWEIGALDDGEMLGLFDGMKDGAVVGDKLSIATNCILTKVDSINLNGIFKLPSLTPSSLSATPWACTSPTPPPSAPRV